MAAELQAFLDEVGPGFTDKAQLILECLRVESLEELTDLVELVGDLAELHTPYQAQLDLKVLQVKRLYRALLDRKLRSAIADETADRDAAASEGEGAPTSALLLDFVTSRVTSMFWDIFCASSSKSHAAVDHDEQTTGRRLRNDRVSLRRDIDTSLALQSDLAEQLSERDSELKEMRAVLVELRTALKTPEAEKATNDEGSCSNGRCKSSMARTSTSAMSTGSGVSLGQWWDDDVRCGPTEVSIYTPQVTPKMSNMSRFSSTSSFRLRGTTSPSRTESMDMEQMGTVTEADCSAERHEPIVALEDQPDLAKKRGSFLVVPDGGGAKRDVSPRRVRLVLSGSVAVDE